MYAGQCPTVHCSADFVPALLLVHTGAGSLGAWHAITSRSTWPHSQGDREAETPLCARGVRGPRRICDKFGCLTHLLTWTCAVHQSIEHLWWGCHSICRSCTSCVFFVDCRLLCIAHTFRSARCTLCSMNGAVPAVHLFCSVSQVATQARTGGWLTAVDSVCVADRHAPSGPYDRQPQHSPAPGTTGAQPCADKRRRRRDATRIYNYSATVCHAVSGACCAAHWMGLRHTHTHSVCARCPGAEASQC